MFGGSFSELAIIFVVALIVLGPARLPGVVRTIGRWVGKARGMARDFQQQLESEINLDELNRMTDIRAPQPRPTTPAPPPELSGDPEAAPLPTETDNVTANAYPYGPQDPALDLASESPPATSPQPGDDSYSHSHAPGEVPLTSEPADPGADHKKDDAAR